MHITEHEHPVGQRIILFILPTNFHEFSRNILYFLFCILYSPPRPPFSPPLRLPISFLILNSYSFFLLSFFFFLILGLDTLTALATRPPAGRTSSRAKGWTISRRPVSPPRPRYVCCARYSASECRTSSSPHGWGRIETAGSVYPAIRHAATLPLCSFGAFTQMESAFSGNAFHSGAGQRDEVLGLKPEEIGVVL